MDQSFDPDKMERLDQAYTDRFARRKGWEDFYLTDPVDDLALFFGHLPGQSILDAGCGWGRYVFRFIDQGLDYAGIDHSVEMLTVAKATNSTAEFKQASFRNIPFPDCHFDGIWSCCALPAVPKHHLETVLREHLRVLKPGGVMYVVMPAAPPESYEEIYLDDTGQPSIFQAHYFIEEFSKYFTDVGFTIIEVDYRYRNGSMYVLAQKPTQEKTG